MKMQGWLLWVAQGFGLGRIPVAPGTFGSLAGLLWLALLLRAGNLWLFLLLLAGGCGLAIWLCGLAETTLRQTDPASVVLDEIAALPLCFLPLVALEWFRHGRLPDPELFFSEHSWPLTLTIFLLFRVFDVLKPWPVRQSQRLPGGWGVVVDDLLAAVYVALGVALVVLL
jgi:phosphatidylglycerophosphatase A